MDTATKIKLIFMKGASPKVVAKLEETVQVSLNYFIAEMEKITNHTFSGALEAFKLEMAGPEFDQTREEFAAMWLARLGEAVVCQHLGQGATGSIACGEELAEYIKHCISHYETAQKEAEAAEQEEAKEASTSPSEAPPSDLN